MMTDAPSHHDTRGAEQFRPRLFGVAYRMLGDVHDAEDLAQEAMLRWQRSGGDDIREPEAWLVSVVTRLAIDRLRQRATERAAYPGPWLPEPITTERMSADYRAELASDLSMAFLVLLERLAPEERAAFLLREVFGTGYDEIAVILDKSAAAVRQTVHRARERVRAERPRFVAPPGAKDRLLERFVSAIEHEDRDELLAVLSAGAEWTSDGGGKVTAARRMVEGAERIARMLVGIEAKYEHPFAYHMAIVNGEPAVMQYLGEKLFSVTFCETDGERITSLYRVMNPEKLAFVS